MISTYTRLIYNKIKCFDISCEKFQIKKMPLVFRLKANTIYFKIEN